MHSTQVVQEQHHCKDLHVGGTAHKPKITVYNTYDILNTFGMNRSVNLVTMCPHQELFENFYFQEHVTTEDHKTSQILHSHPWVSKYFLYNHYCDHSITVFMPLLFFFVG